MAINASDRPNDRFGYSVYAGVLLAPAAQQRTVQGLRDKIRPQRAMLPAHVTVKGTFCDIKSLEEVDRLFAEVASTQSAPFIRLESPRVQVMRNASVLAVVRTTELVAIYDDFRAVLGPVVTDAYGYDAQGYAPHLTLWEECPPENLDLARRLAKEIKLGGGFTAYEVSLVGRIGPAHGGRWTTVKTYRLGGAP